MAPWKHQLPGDRGQPKLKSAQGTLISHFCPAAFWDLQKWPCLERWRNHVKGKEKKINGSKGNINTLKTTLKPFTNSIVTFQIWLCFLSAKAEYRKWIFINTNYVFFFSEGPVAIEILLETVSVSAIQSEMSLFSAELLAKPYRHCNVNLTETVLQRDHIPTSSLTRNVRKAPREGWRHVSYLLHHSNVTSVGEHSLSSLMRLEPNMASLVYGSIHSPYWNVCFYRILPALSSFFYAMAF